MGEGTGREGVPECRGQPGQEAQSSPITNAIVSSLSSAGLGVVRVQQSDSAYSSGGAMEKTALSATPLASVVNFALFGVLSYLGSGLPTGGSRFQPDRNHVKTCCFPASSCITEHSGLVFKSLASS